MRELGLLGAVAMLFAFAAMQVQGEFGLFSGANLVIGGAALLVAGVRGLRSLGQRSGESAASPVRDAILSVIAIGWGCVLLEGFAAHTQARADLTFESSFGLADSTVRALEALGPDLELTLYYDPLDPRRRRTRLMLEQMGDVAGAKVRAIDIEHIGDDEDRYGIGVSNTVIVATPRGWDRIERPGEGALFEALSRLASSEPRRIYVTVGTGEGDLERRDDRGYSGLEAALTTEGYDVIPLFSAYIDRVPTDATLLLAIAPERALLEPGLDAIRAYLAEGGRMLALLEPGRQSGLERVLADYGLTSPEGVVIDPASGAIDGAPRGMTPLAFNYADHPASRGLDRNRVTVFPGARTFELRKPDPADRLRAFVLSSPNAWTHADASVLERRSPIDPPVGVRTDYLPLAVAGSYRRDGRETRIVAFGDADFASNRYLRAVYNLDLLMNSVHWVAERESEITLRPKAGRTVQFPVPIQNSLRAFYGVGLLVPELLLLVGGFVWLRRRHG